MKKNSLETVCTLKISELDHNIKEINIGIIVLPTALSKALISLVIFLWKP